MPSIEKQFPKQSQMNKYIRNSQGPFTQFNSTSIKIASSSDGVNADGSMVVTSTGARMISTSTYVVTVNNTGITLEGLIQYADDSAAATGGVPLNYLYINTATGAITQRIT